MMRAQTPTGTPTTKISRRRISQVSWRSKSPTTTRTTKRKRNKIRLSFSSPVFSSTVALCQFPSALPLSPCPYDPLIIPAPHPLSLLSSEWLVRFAVRFPPSFFPISVFRFLFLTVVPSLLFFDDVTKTTRGPPLPLFPTPSRLSPPSAGGSLSPPPHFSVIPNPSQLFLPRSFPFLAYLLSDTILALPVFFAKWRGAGDTIVRCRNTVCGMQGPLDPTANQIP